ncbi:hypothetical protein QA640_38165 [Bradyrhizobium sp. CB82]|uniref:ABC transporter permease n=1 Tax=Bradyrhizobium sp. CB82 TaxID=3039159 RepID=UPI0024B26EEB|nr:hypothetical protein [Bradyrhizobium sp. CB82]WFU40019.1 hypothetical protein QA640_38165 [Bradyrhizobium sp. CB82]
MSAISTNNLRAQVIFMSPATLIGGAIVLPPLSYVLFTSFRGPEFSLAAFDAVLTSALFRRTLLTTLYVAAISSVVSLILGFVIALHLARQPARRRKFLMVLVLLPFWTSVLVKCFAFTVILGRDGIINSFLSWISATNVQLPLLFNVVGLL